MPGRSKKIKEKIGPTTIREIRPGYYLADLVSNAKRVKKCFKDIGQAREWAESKAHDLKNQGTDSLELSEKVRLEVAGLIRKLNGRATLTKAVEFWLERNPDGTHETWDQTFARYIEYMTKHGCRQSSITDKRVKVSVLSRLLNNPTTVSVDEKLLKEIVAEAAKANKWSLSTEQAYMSAGLTILRFYDGKNRQHRDKDQEAPLTWDSATISKMMATAVTDAPQIVPGLAVMTFAGLRPNEALRLTWENIIFEEGIISLTGAMTKTRNARNVTLTPNLKKWLLPYRKASGLIVSSAIKFKRGRDKLKEKMKLTEWPTDVLRHTCATYLYARTNDLNLTAAQLGHFDTKTFLTFYKGNPPMDADVKKFWNIVPVKKGGDRVTPVTASDLVVPILQKPTVTRRLHSSGTGSKPNQDPRS